MNISSRTPEGRPNHCDVCGHDLRLEPSIDSWDAPCPYCGHLLWFSDHASQPESRPIERRVQPTPLCVVPLGPFTPENLRSLILDSEHSSLGPFPNERRPVLDDLIGRLERRPSQAF